MRRVRLGPSFREEIVYDNGDEPLDAMSSTPWSADWRPDSAPDPDRTAAARAGRWPLANLR